jgi:hypothetical protein
MEKIIGKKMNKNEIKDIIYHAKGFKAYDDKLKFLHNKFVDQKCYILGCGPSILEVDKTKLSEELKNNLCLSIKLIYFSFLDLVDFHFFNCNNYKTYPSNEKSFFVAQSDFCSEASAQRNVWGSQQYDISVEVPRQSKDQTLTNTKDFNKWTFNNSGLQRPWGPGIMYESVLFFVQHLGCKEIKTIGWDYKDPNDNKKIEHFYLEDFRTSKLKNPANQPHENEIQDSISLSQEWSNYFTNQGKNIQCYDSSRCFIDKSINRFKI